MSLDDGACVHGVGDQFSGDVAEGKPDVEVFAHHLGREVRGVGSGIALCGILHEGGQGLVFSSDKDLYPVAFTVRITGTVVLPGYREGFRGGQGEGEGYGGQQGSSGEGDGRVLRRDGSCNMR